MVKKSLKVAFVCNHFLPSYGGIEKHVLLLSREIMKKGGRVFVITTNVTNGKPAPLPSIEIIDGVKVIRAKAHLMIGRLKKFTFCPSLIHLFFKVKPDIVHVHSFWPFFSTYISILLSKIRRIPTIITPHYHPTRTKKFSIYDHVIGPLMLRLAECVIALTQSEASHYRQIGVKNVVVIPNGTNLEGRTSIRDMRSFREKYGLGDNVILSVGRIEKRKGFQHLIYATSILVGRSLNVQLAIIGNDWGHLKRLKLLVQELGIRSHVMFLNNLDDRNLSIAYECCRLVATASDYEAFGITAIEAWAHKKPVIASRVGGIPDFADPSVAILVPYGDQKAFAEAIENLLSDKALADRIGSNGYNLVKQQYTSEKVAGKILKVYSRFAKPERQ